MRIYYIIKAHTISFIFSYYWISDISLWNTLYMVINVSVQGLGNEPFSAAQQLKALSAIALVWELHYLGISCEDKQSRRLQLPPKTNLPLCHPTASLKKPPRAAAPTPFLKATAQKFRVIYLQMSFYHCAVIQPKRKQSKEKEEVSMKSREERERERKGGQKAGDVIKIEREWER